MELNSREVQLRNEIQADNEAAVDKLKAWMQEATEGSVEHPRSRRFVSAAYTKVAKIIQEYQDAKTRGRGGMYRSWLRAIPAETAAVIAIRECIRQCTGHKEATVQSLTSSIGRLYELETRISEATAVNPLYMQRVNERIKRNNTRALRHLNLTYKAAYNKIMGKDYSSNLTNTEAINLGKFGLDACYQAGIVQQFRTNAKKGTLVYFELHPDVYTFLHGYTEGDVRSVMNVEAGSMICPPDPWETMYDGGYLSVRRKAASPLVVTRKLRRETRARLNDTFTAETAPLIFSTANYLQEVPFRMHAPTLEAIRKVWLTGGGVLGVPHRSPPERPAFPLPEGWVKKEASEEEMDTFLRWKRHAAEHYRELREWRGRVREIGGFLRASARNEGDLWFPVYMDTRGRWYYRGTPNPQGSDLSKSVLHFAKKKPLGERGLFWLKVHIANSFGYDTERMHKRAEWTEQNWDTIQRALDAPEEHIDVWGTDAPWCMFSAAWELREAFRSGSPEEYCTGVPVGMDATCSGIQHFAALLRDPVAAKAVNLTDPKDGGPKADIYRAVTEATYKSIQESVQAGEYKDDPNTEAIAKFWLKVGIPRDMGKKPIMTFLYGATLIGTARYVRDYVEDEMPEVRVPKEHALKFYMFLAKKLFEGIAEAVPAATAAMEWLQEVVRARTERSGMCWHTPTGFPVQHDYQSFTDHRITLRSCGVVFTAVREYGGDVRSVPMRNAISPNFVHALDASHLTLTADAMREHGLDFIGVHDSFGTHACDVDTLQKITREKFVELYETEDALLNFKKEVGTDLELPEKGNFDLSEVLDSEFFFS